MTVSKESRRLMWVTLSLAAVIVLLLAGLTWTLIKNREQASLIALIKKADKGDPEAQMLLGEKYYLGDKPFEVNYERAFELFRKSAEAGNAAGQFDLGRMYYFGYGVTRDVDTAFRWYEKAVKSGSARACVFLGMEYLEGKHVPKDAKRGRELLIEGAKRGDTFGFSVLGKFKYSHLGKMSSAEKIEKYQWLYLAKAAGDRLAEISMRTLAKRMTPEEIRTAEENAKSWNR